MGTILLTSSKHVEWQLCCLLQPDGYHGLEPQVWPLMWQVSLGRRRLGHVPEPWDPFRDILLQMLPPDGELFLLFANERTWKQITEPLVQASWCQISQLQGLQQTTHLKPSIFAFWTHGMPKIKEFICENFQVNANEERETPESYMVWLVCWRAGMFNYLYLYWWMLLYCGNM